MGSFVGLRPKGITLSWERPMAPSERKKKEHPYLIYKFGHDLKLWRCGPHDFGDAEWNLRPDGWATPKGRKKDLKRRRRWVVSVAAQNYDASTPVVRRSKLDASNIRKLEALRWRAMTHAQAHHQRLYTIAEDRCRALGSGAARFIEGTTTFKVVFGSRNRYLGERDADCEPIALPSDATLVDRIAQLPTPEAPEWIAGEALAHERRAGSSAWYRVGRVTAALDAALRLYIAMQYPEIARNAHRRVTGLTVHFTINGRHYPVSNANNRDNDGNRWPNISDIYVSLDSAQPAELGELEGATQ